MTLEYLELLEDMKESEKLKVKSEEFAAANHVFDLHQKKMAAPFGAAINYQLSIINFRALVLQRLRPYLPH